MGQSWEEMKPCHEMSIPFAACLNPIRALLSKNLHYPINYPSLVFHKQCDTLRRKSILLALVTCSFTDAVKPLGKSRKHLSLFNEPSSSMITDICPWI